MNSDTEPSPRMKRCTNTFIVLVIILMLVTGLSWLVNPVNYNSNGELDHSEIPILDPYDVLYDVEWSDNYQQREFYVATGDTFHRVDSGNGTTLNSYQLFPKPGYALTILDITVSDIGNAYLAAFGTNKSIPFYDRYGDRFWNLSIFNLEEDTYFTEIEWTLIDGDNFLLVGCASNPYGLGLINCTGNEIRYLNTSDGILDDFITAIKIQGDDVFLGTDKGFSILDISTETIVLNENEDDYNQEFRVNCIEYYPYRNRIYVGTDTGLLVYEVQDEQTSLIHSRFTTVDGLPHNKINCLTQDEQRKRVYIGTREGVCYINLDEPEVDIHLLANSTELAGYNVKSILIPRTDEYILLGADGFTLSVPPSIITLPTSANLFSSQIEFVISLGGFVSAAVSIIVMVVYPEFKEKRRGHVSKQPTTDVDKRKTPQEDNWAIDSEYVVKQIQENVEEPLIELKAQINVSTNKEKAEFIRDMIAMANRSLADGQRGLILVGPKSTGFEGTAHFLDDANYQSMVNSKVRQKIVFLFKPIENEEIPYGAFILQPRGVVPIITKKWVDKDGILLKDGECWLREGTKKTLLNQEEYAKLAQEIDRQPR
jgi:hypothetical protein